MSLLEKFKKTGSMFSKISAVDFFSNKFATGYTKNITKTQFDNKQKSLFTKDDFSKDKYDPTK